LTRPSEQLLDQAYNDFRDHIDLWGHQQNLYDYEWAIFGADFVVSTSSLEFFGISIVEAIADEGSM
jgi:hypothetical protein